MILLVIASYSDQRGEWIADQATLQRRSRLGRRRVQKLLEELVDAGELAVLPGDGRGKRSTFRLTISAPSERAAAHSAPFPTKGALQTALSQKRAQPPPKSARPFPPKGRTPDRPFSPPCPPLSPFPPHPQSPLNPPRKTGDLRSPPAPGASPQGAHGREPRRGAGPKPILPCLPSPVRGGGRGGTGEGPGERAPIPGPLPTSAPSSPRQIRRLPSQPPPRRSRRPPPTPAQIGLWSKTLGGIEPLLELLRRLIQAGLATKREPIAYVHRVVMERAARPEPARPSAAPAAPRTSCCDRRRPTTSGAPRPCDIIADRARSDE